MRSWQIIIAGAAAATIVDALIFQSGGLPSRPELVVLLLAHWPAIAIVWLSLYGIVALVLTTVTIFIEAGRVAPRRVWDDSARRYVVQLAVTQYFTSVFALLGLGLSRISVEPVPFLVLPSPISGSPALAAGAAVIIVGLLGALFLTATLETPEKLELRLLREIIELVRARAPAPATAAVDTAPLAELIERGQRSVLEALKDLATAVNRLRRGLGEIKAAVQGRGPGRPTQSDPTSPSAVEDAAAELRAAVAAMDALVARLGELDSLLSANEPPVVAGSDTPTSPGSRAQLSTELQTLLREMSPDAAGSRRPG